MTLLIVLSVQGHAEANPADAFGFGARSVGMSGAMTASAEQLKQALQNSPMADAPEVRAAAAASSRVLRGRFRARRLAYAYSASGGGWTEQ